MQAMIMLKNSQEGNEFCMFIVMALLFLRPVGGESYLVPDGVNHFV